MSWSGIKTIQDSGEVLCIKRTSAGERIILPSLSPGNPRYLYRSYQNWIEIARKMVAQIFVTFTYDDASYEISEALLPRLHPSHISEIFMGSSKFNWIF